MPTASLAPIALVTGASSGIGESLARACAQAGYSLVLVARSADKLKALAASLREAYGVKVWVAPADLSVPGAAQTLAESQRRARRPVELLINNAGVLEHGAFVDISAARHQELIALNVAGLTALLSAFVPAMVARGSGRVLNVASVAAFQPVPSLASYAATKAYVLSLTESLAEELKDSGVTVTALCPGITATSMLAGAQAASSELKALPHFLIGNADEVAEQGLQACLAGRVICVPGVVNQAGTLVSRATPKWLLRRISGALVRRLK